MKHTETRKVTMNLPADLVERAMQSTGASLTETTRRALEELTHKEACKKLLAMYGKVDIGMTWQELKALDDE